MAKRLLKGVIALAVLGVLFLIFRGVVPNIGRPEPTPRDRRPVQVAASQVASRPAPKRDVIEQREADGRLARRIEFADAVPYPDRVELTQMHAILYHKPDTAGRIAVTTLDADEAALYRRQSPTEQEEEEEKDEPTQPMIVDENLEFGDAALKGNVRVFHDGGTTADTADDIHFKSEAVTFRETEGRLKAPGAVSGDGAGIAFTGEGLTTNFDLEKQDLQRVRIERNAWVRMTGRSSEVLFGAEERKPAKGAKGTPQPPEPTVITCTGDFQLLVVQRRATFYRNVTVVQGEASLKADERLEVEFDEPERRAPKAGATGVHAVAENVLGPPKRVEAYGNLVRLNDPREGRRFVAEGQSLELDVTNRIGWLRGRPKATVRQGDDTVVTAATFRFDRSEGRNEVRAVGGPVLDVVQAAETPDGKPKRVHVACGGPMVLDGRTNMKATLTEKVKVSVTEDGAVTSRVNADRMEVFFSGGDGASDRRDITRLAAFGSVDALEAGRRMRSDELDIRFGAVAGRRRVTRLHVKGNVDMRELQTERRATADEVIHDPVGRTTTFVGRLATLEEPGRTIAAARLIVDDRTDPPRVRAEGHGRIRMTADRDEEGRPFKAPQKHIIDWRRSMSFDPSPDTLTGSFLGDVVAVMPEGRKLECGKLDLGFSRDKGGGMNIEWIVGGMGVTFVSGPGEFVKGETLTWNVKTQDGTVEGPDGGLATVRQGENDINAPLIKIQRKTETVAAEGPGFLRLARGKAEPAGEDASSVRWTRRMLFDGAKKLAQFRGDVEAEFSGRELSRSRSGTPSGGLARLSGDDVKTIQMICSSMDVTFIDLPDTGAARRGRKRQAVRDLVARDGVQVEATSENRTVRRFDGSTVRFARDTGLIRVEGGPAGPARFWAGGKAEDGAPYQDQLVAQQIDFYPDRAEVLTRKTTVLSYTPRSGSPTTKPTKPADPSPWRDIGSGRE